MTVSRSRQFVALPRVRRWIARHHLAAFVLVAFGWSWSWDAVFLALGGWESLPTSLPRQWGVPLGAAVVVWASDASLRAWLRRVLDWRHRPGLYLVAVAVPLTVTNLPPVLRAVGGGALTYDPPAALGLVVLFVLVNAAVLGGSEEIGWRGYLQPALQERTSVLTAGLCVGVLWWAWHLPLFLGHPNFPLEAAHVLQYTLFVVGLGVVLGAFVNVTDGAVVPLMVMHGTVNLGPLFAGSGGVLEGAVPLSLIVGAGAWWAIVLVLVAAYGRSMVPNPGVERRV